MMLNNDLGPSYGTERRVGIIFEHLVASPPAQKVKLFKRSTIPPLRRWHINDLPYRSLKRIQSKGIPIEVYTFLEEEWAAEIDDYLRAWGVDPYTTLAFDKPSALAQYLRGDINIHTVWTSNETWAAFLGMRIVVTSPDRELAY